MTSTFPYPFWNCVSLEPEKLDDRRIPYSPWNSRSLKVEKINGRYTPQHFENTGHQKQKS